MRNKNTVIFLLVVFTAICGYNLYWTYVQFDSDGELANYREQVALLDSNKANWSVADSAVSEEYAALLTDEEFQGTRKKAISNSFSLGLDLQGGMFVTLELGIRELVKNQAGNQNDPALIAALDCASQKQQEQAQSYVSLFVSCYKEQNPNGSLGVLFSSEELNISVSSTDDEVATILEDKATSAIDRTFNILRTRIDQFGVVSPNLQKQESTGRILLELPGVKEPERVRKLLQNTAELEFYVCRPISETAPYLTAINEFLRTEQGLNDTTATDSADADAVAVAEGGETEGDEATGEEEVTDGDEEEGSSELSDLVSGESDSAAQELSQEEELARFKRENPFFAVLSPNTQPSGQNDPTIGYSRYTDTAEVNRILAREEIQALIPEDLKFVWSFKGIEGNPEIYRMIGIRLNEDGQADLNGDAVATARQDFDPTTGRAVVSMRMTAEGTKTWGLMTQANVNNHIAILLDKSVYSFPVVNQPILTGNSQISGDFTPDEAKDLANVLEAGKLDVRPRIEGEETVGPTLGAENINSGMLSFIGAFIVTLIFMGIYYARSGIIANLALVANLFFILGCSAAFTIVLTLPGIAAVVLTVGMAVDANVLIFERIREELKKDKTLKASIKAGFSNAFSSVMDANITTFLTGVVLYVFGVGPIRGFAVSLMIGIVTSLISALIITRLILDYYANRGGQSLNFGFSWTTGLFDQVKINMVSRRKLFYYISLGVVAVGLVGIFIVKPKTGVDFKGGRQFKMEFLDQNGAPNYLDAGNIEQIRKDLANVFTTDAPIIKTVSSDNQLLITTAFLITDRTATDSVKNMMIASLQQTLGAETQINVLRVSDVGPTVANDIQTAAVYSVIFSLLIIFLYILIRFRKWQYSLGAVAAVFHDVIIVLGIFSLLSEIDLGFNLEVDQAFIAALLTIIGYSINDTVVVFDRIRENLGEMKASPLKEIYNVSIDQTISRTLITSFTTFLTALILFLFGGDVIRGFMFAILIGIVVGTYSSIFVASPISLDLLMRDAKDEVKA
ncbi:MAG: protein translocase subunit SecDF [Bacteroidota bacterium]